MIYSHSMVPVVIDSAEAGSGEALIIGHRYLMTMSASLIILFLIYAYRSGLQSVGSSIPSMISGFTECGARVLVAKGLYLWLGQKVLYFSEPAAWLGSLGFIMGAYYVLRNRYLSKIA